MLSTTCGPMCNIFRSSTCHRIVHWFPLIVLFATQLSYGFNTNSHLSSCPLRSYQNSNAACSVPYKAFRSSIYMTGLPFSSVMYSVYFSLFTFVRSFASGPESCICTVSSISAYQEYRTWRRVIFPRRRSRLIRIAIRRQLLGHLFLLWSYIFHLRIRVL